MSVSVCCSLFLTNHAHSLCFQPVQRPTGGNTASIDSDRLGLACTHLLTIAQALQSIDKKLDVVLASARVSGVALCVGILTPLRVWQSHNRAKVAAALARTMAVDGLVPSDSEQSDDSESDAEGEGKEEKQAKQHKHKHPRKRRRSEKKSTKHGSGSAKQASAAAGSGSGKKANALDAEVDANKKVRSIAVSVCVVCVASLTLPSAGLVLWRQRSSGSSRVPASCSVATRVT